MAEAVMSSWVVRERYPRGDHGRRDLAAMAKHTLTIKKSLRHWRKMQVIPHQKEKSSHLRRIPNPHRSLAVCRSNIHTLSIKPFALLRCWYKMNLPVRAMARIISRYTLLKAKSRHRNVNNSNHDHKCRRHTRSVISLGTTPTARL